MPTLLIVCTGNTCRSQMAEGIVKSLRPGWEVYSAGTHPGPAVNPFAVQVMKELGLDISRYIPKNVKSFINKDFDYVITVCDHAKEVCPVFRGHVGEQLHMGFPDPADAVGTDEEILGVYRKTRDDICREFGKWLVQIKK